LFQSNVKHIRLGTCAVFAYMTKQWVVNQLFSQKLTKDIAD